MSYYDTIIGTMYYKVMLLNIKHKYKNKRKMNKARNTNNILYIIEFWISR